MVWHQLLCTRCVDALHTREAARKAGEPLPYVPYQDAKLTMLLAEGLGGSAKTAVTESARARRYDLVSRYSIFEDLAVQY